MILIAGLVILLAACVRPWGYSPGNLWGISNRSTATAVIMPSGQRAPLLVLPTARPVGIPVLTPTPDAPHSLPTPRSEAEKYSVQSGDTLGLIANRYGVSVELLVQANKLANPDRLDIGQVLRIPVPTPLGPGSAFKIIPDSELVYGPASISLDVQAFVQGKAGFLASYKEEVEYQSLSSAQIVLRVAQEFSVNPRLLLALIEQQSGWLTNPNPQKEDREYPLGLVDPLRKGLYKQLAWTANGLNRGYYLWRVNGRGTWSLNDGSIVSISPAINAGTAGVQQLYAQLYGRVKWEQAVSDKGLFATYYALFGYPFDYTIEPLLPLTLLQPVMQLPFEAGQAWAFTSGPHGAWGDGAAWAALDFAPPGDALGCVQSDAWVAAVADGLVVRVGNGVVVLDLDGDGFEQTGWTVLYLHIETSGRVLAGVYLKAGERIGHPSCEGGISTGTHVHIARRYNGEWVPADQGIPFALDGWISSGTGVEYDGYLQRGDQKVEAYFGRLPENVIKR